MRKVKDLDKKLNLSHIKLWENARLSDDFNLPIHHCSPTVLPDSIKLFRKCSDFSVASNEAIGHYVYDRVFDNKNGLYTAIRLNDKKQLGFYRRLYSRANFIIAHDFSVFDDIDPRENYSRLIAIRTTMLWLVLNTNSIVIPNAVYVPKDKMDEYYSGLKDCSVICFSTKSHVRYHHDRARIREHVKYVVDYFPNLRVILIYSVSGKDETSLSLFSYAVDNGIKVRILNNEQRTRNMKRLGVAA